MNALLVQVCALVAARLWLTGVLGFKTYGSCVASAMSAASAEPIRPTLRSRVSKLRMARRFSLSDIRAGGSSDASPAGLGLGGLRNVGDSLAMAPRQPGSCVSWFWVS